MAAWLPDEEKVAILQDTGSSFEDTQTAATFPVNLYIKGYKVGTCGCSPPYTNSSLIGIAAYPSGYSGTKALHAR